MRQPKRKFYQQVRGQLRKYHYLTAVNSLEELDQFRLENFCAYMSGGKPLHMPKPITMPCKWKKSRKGCTFELKALPPKLADHGTIHVYGHSQHNHRLVSPTIRKRIQLTIKNCPQLARKQKLRVVSTPIELVGFEWSLQATRKTKGFLAMYLHAEPPYGFHGNYRIEVDWRISILNAFTDKNLVLEETGYIYTKKENNRNGRGCRYIAKFEELLDPVQTFLTPEGNIETWVDFTIKSATLTQQQEEQMEIDGKEYPLNKCQRHLESNLRKFEIERTKKWMSRIDQTEIGQVITEMDVENVAHLMIMADIDICRCEERLEFWVQWIKKVIRQRKAEMAEFVMNFKNLRKVESLSTKLKAKIQQMVDSRLAGF